MPADPILTPEQVHATALSIARQQYPSGAIPWYAAFDGYPAGHVDAWNHIEAAMALTVAGLTGPARRAYAWLRDQQRHDGSWPAKWEDERVTETGGESNHAAYIAVGMWHELLVTGDEEYVRGMWPVVRRAVDYVLTLRTPRGDIKWIRFEDGTPGEETLLTGCSSIHQALRCAVALAERLGEPRPDWELAADQLGHVIAHHPEAFADKSRWSMDWYYPILGGAVRGERAAALIEAQWDTFVVPELGCRCVSDQPWVTGAETCELIMALDAAGDPRALTLFGQIQFLRHEDGSYWTGWQFRDQRHFPGDRSTYTAAAVVLAADALYGLTPAARIFKEIAGRPLGPVAPADPVACGCAQVPART
ncbi:prenyltransferase [Actinocorallia libanotica]|uniref:Prenyltransferase n=1 Tax=Actinocorallia libanotica TaxID=46162 RepID=A0ABP4B8Y5_9ACTN